MLSAKPYSKNKLRLDIGKPMFQALANANFTNTNFKPEKSRLKQ